MVDCCNAPGLMPMALAKQKLLASITAVTDIEFIPLIECDQRINAHEILSPVNVPAHNNSAMDGYAICVDYETNIPKNAGKSFEIVGTAMAGKPFTGSLKQGQCIRIMTGAVVPDSANAVEMQENVTVNDNKISLSQTTPINNHIRLAGEDISKNQIVFAVGHKFSSIDIGLLASLGVAKIAVWRKPKIAVFSTGDELKSVGETLNFGDIYESNRYTLIAMLKRLNVDIIDLGIIEDDKTKITRAFESANKQADAVVSSGGVSVGDADYTKEVLDELGNIEFWKVAMKPGKPFAFGQLPNSVFFGLPGNPVSAAVTFHQLAIPAIKKMSGQNQIHPLRINAKTTKKVNKRAGRMDYQRGIAETEDGVLSVTPLSHQGSGVLSSMSSANCYIVLPQEHQGCEAGEIVEIELFDNIIN